MSTIKTLEVQVMRRVKAGDLNAGTNLHPMEVRKAIEQSINNLLKVEFFNEILPTGETIPDGCILATYDGIAVVAWNGVSKSTLPAIPVKLPRNMGVFHVGKTTDAFNGFIPMKMGMFSQVSQQRLMSDLFGQYGYELRGKEVIYTKDLTTETPAINSVTMRLIVSDITKFTDYEILPINADMEKMVVEEVVQMFLPEPIIPEIASSVSDVG